MRILLINPFVTAVSPARQSPPESLGLLYIASYFNAVKERYGIDAEIQIFDAQREGAAHTVPTERGFRSGMTDSEVLTRLTALAPDIVGITNNFTSFVADALTVAALAKKANPSCTVILGGAHATIAHTSLVLDANVDIVVRSEGEVSFVETVQALPTAGLTAVAGITWKCNGKAVVNPDRPFIDDLDTLPIPDRSLIPYEAYIANQHFANVLGRRNAKIFSSRGCPYKCVFCSTREVWRNKWRGRSAANILAEIEYLVERYGVDEITFEDDQFMGSRDRIRELCERIISRKLNIHFAVPSGISPALVDRDILSLMKRAGFYRVTFSIDAGHADALRFTHKPVRLERMRDLIRSANGLGLWTAATFIVGFPDETEDAIKQTIRFSYGLKLDFITFYVAQPHLGSELHDIYRARGLIGDDAAMKGHSTFESVVGTHTISAARLQQIRDRAESRYIIVHILHLFDPRYVIREFLPKISDPTGIRYFFMLIGALAIKIRQYLTPRRES